MRSLYKISLAILAVSFLVVAGSAFAQDKPNMTITGDIGGAFGSFNYDNLNGHNATGAGANTKAFSEWVTSYESNLRFTWSTDQLTAIGRARVRGNSSGSGTANSLQTGASNDTAGGQSSNNAFLEAGTDFFTEVWWTPGAFKLGIGKFQGQDWSNPLAGNYIMRNNIGDGEYWLNWTGITGLDAEYNVGIVQVGVALSNTCIPSCNGVSANNSLNGNAPGNIANGGTTVSGGSTNQQPNTEDHTLTVVPHIAGKVGDISFRGQLPQSSGTVNNHLVPTATKTAGNGTAANPLALGTATESKTASGSGYQVGVAWAGMPGVRVALDISSFTDTHIADAGQLKDRQRDGLALRVDFPAGPGAINIGYWQLGDTCPTAQYPSAAIACAYLNTKEYTTTNTTVRYMYPVSFGYIVPEYRAVNTGGAIAPASTVDNSKQQAYKDAAASEYRLILQGRF